MKCHGKSESPLQRQIEADQVGELKGGEEEQDVGKRIENLDFARVAVEHARLWPEYHGGDVEKIEDISCISLLQGRGWFGSLVLEPLTEVRTGREKNQGKPLRKAPWFVSLVNGQSLKKRRSRVGES